MINVHLFDVWKSQQTALFQVSLSDGFSVWAIGRAKWARTVSSNAGAIEQRKQRLAKMLARGGEAITYNEHLNHDGALVFEHACRLGLEGIVSKRLDAPYRSGPSKTWLKSKNPLSEAVRREREEDWSWNIAT
jgi:hypothetical protein